MRSRLLVPTDNVRACSEAVVPARYFGMHQVPTRGLFRSENGLFIAWAVTGSNRRPPRCKRGALPAELTALELSPLKRFSVDQGNRGEAGSSTPYRVTGQLPTGECPRLPGRAGCGYLDERDGAADAESRDTCFPRGEPAEKGGHGGGPPFHCSPRCAGVGGPRGGRRLRPTGASSLRQTSRSPDQVASIAHTLLSTRPSGSATSRTTSSVMSVATPELRFRQAIQSERSGKTAWPSASTCSSKARRSPTKRTTTSADSGRRRTWRRAARERSARARSRDRRGRRRRRPR